MLHCYSTPISIEEWEDFQCLCGIRCLPHIQRIPRRVESIQQFKLVGFGWCPCSHAGMLSGHTKLNMGYRFMVECELYPVANPVLRKCFYDDFSKKYSNFPMVEALKYIQFLLQGSFECFRVSFNQIRGNPSHWQFPSRSELNYKLISRLKNFAPEEIPRWWLSSLI